MCGLQPGLEVGDERTGTRLPGLTARFEWQPADIRLDGIESADALKRFTGDGGAIRLMDVEELAADMRPTRHLGDCAALGRQQAGRRLKIELDHSEGGVDQNAARSG